MWGPAANALSYVLDAAWLSAGDFEGVRIHDTEEQCCFDDVVDVLDELPRAARPRPTPQTEGDPVRGR